MIPQRLQDWSIDIILNLLQKGYFEAETFDFKECLPHRENKNDKERLYKTCCAFANSSGGFLVFGIDDDKTKGLTERLVGLPLETDFPEHFGNYPQDCTPSIDWDFLNPPLSLESGMVIHIAHIPKSWKAPHGRVYKDSQMLFTKRTNKGNASMDYEEVKQMFLGYYEKLLKLQLLKAELLNIKQTAGRMILDEASAKNQCSVHTLDTQILQSVLSDTYSILYKKPSLIQTLLQIRTESTAINNKFQLFILELTNPYAQREKLGLKHNEWVAKQALEIQCSVQAALNELKEIMAS